MIQLRSGLTADKTNPYPDAQVGQAPTRMNRLSHVPVMMLLTMASCGCSVARPRQDEFPHANPDVPGCRRNAGLIKGGEVVVAP